MIAAAGIAAAGIIAFAIVRSRKKAASPASTNPDNGHWRKSSP